MGHPPFDPRAALAHTWCMPNAPRPQPDLSKRPPAPLADPPANDPGPTDAADLLTPTGTLSHGGRAYRRELVARMLAGKVQWTPHDVRTAVATANQVVLALAGTPPTQVAETPPTR